MSLVLFVQNIVSADTTGNGSTGVYAVVPAPPITKPAIISSPSTGQLFTNSDPVTVNGSCPQGSLIKIYDDEVMSGAVLCQGQKFSVQVGLFVGGNSLVARAYNVNDIPGPDSNPVTVQLRAPGVSLPSGNTFDPTQAPAGQFFLTSEVYYRGGRPGDTMSWPITPVGGQPPYTVSVNWGDGKSDVLNRPNASPFNITHSYSKAASGNGTYTVTIKGTDQKGNTATLQIFALIPGGEVTSTTTSSSNHHLVAYIQTTWRTLMAVAFLAFFFWYFEKRKLHFSLHHHIIR